MASIGHRLHLEQSVPGPSLATCQQGVPPFLEGVGLGLGQGYGGGGRPIIVLEAGAKGPVASWSEHPDKNYDGRQLP